MNEYCSARQLDRLIWRQHYVFAQWKEAAKRINYRRFFNIAGLVSLRMELPEVFTATHALLWEWLNAGKVSALRVDHPDGLWNPKQYFERFSSAATKALGGSARAYVVAEKILSGNEALPDEWPVDGTTGYDFLNRVNALFIDRAKESAFTNLYREFLGFGTDFRTVCHDCKKQILETSLAADVCALTHQLCELIKESPARELNFEKLKAALVEIIAAFPVYRTYVTETSARPSPADCVSIERALADARKRNSSLDASALQFIRRLLLLEPPVWLEPDRGSLARRFVMRFQRLTGPAMAKGLEDTAFYRFNRLISLNEVGGDPAWFGVTVQEFHDANSRTAAQWPHTLLATSTHDTKRGEDVRARLNVLSEMPEEWRDAVLHWRELNGEKKSFADGQLAPSANDEYLLYQSLVGAWPSDAEQPGGLPNFRERVTSFMLKAVREAKVNTSWTEPNHAYENAVGKFVKRILTEVPLEESHDETVTHPLPRPEDTLSPVVSGGEEDSSFLREFRAFQRKVSFFGALNSLSQTLLKVTSPGVPDFYQGAELWDLSFVDPDNRGPVDYELRKKLLADLEMRFRQCGGNPCRLALELLAHLASGQIKMFVTSRALDLRRRFGRLFQDGGYVPLLASGSRREHVCAFARMLRNNSVITIAPRLVYGLTGGRREFPVGSNIWGNTAIQLPQPMSGISFRNVFSGETISAAQDGQARALEMSLVFQSFPLALLEPQC